MRALHGAIEATSAERAPDLARDLDRLGEALDRRGIAIADVLRGTAAFGVAIASWGTGTGGTRFARFPGPGEPAGIMDALDDCGAVQALGRATPSVSLHFPWDRADPADLVAKAEEHGLTFDAVNAKRSRMRRASSATGSAPRARPTPASARRRSRTTSGASSSAAPSARSRRPSGSGTAPTSPASRT